MSAPSSSAAAKAAATYSGRDCRSASSAMVSPGLTAHSMNSRRNSMASLAGLISCIDAADGRSPATIAYGTRSGKPAWACSVDLRAAGLDHGRPFRGFGGDEGAEFGGAVANRLIALLGQPGGDRRRLERGHEGG